MRITTSLDNEDSFLYFVFDCSFEKLQYSYAHKYILELNWFQKITKILSSSEINVFEFLIEQDFYKQTSTLYFFSYGWHKSLYFSIGRQQFICMMGNTSYFKIKRYLKGLKGQSVVRYNYSGKLYMLSIITLIFDQYQFITNNEYLWIYTVISLDISIFFLP